MQKRITALADIRNNAAHGHPEQFRDNDVSDMISYVRASSQNISRLRKADMHVHCATRYRYQSAPDLNVKSDLARL